MTLLELYLEGGQALASAGIADSQIDARELLLSAFGLDLTHYLLERRRELPETASCRETVRHYRIMVEQRARHVPLQQLLQSAEFMGLPFYIDEHVLIPRQDTETLVELALAHCRARNVGHVDASGADVADSGVSDTGVFGAGASGNGVSDADISETGGLRLLDLCTGSGCIAISLAVQGLFRQVDAADLSAEALRVAEKNARALCAGMTVDGGILSDAGAVLAGSGTGMEETVPDAWKAGKMQTYRAADDGKKAAAGRTFRLLPGDLFDAVPCGTLPYDVITANPPYIPTQVIEGLSPEVRDHEPRLALDGSADGLEFYRRIAAEAGAYLVPGGRLFLEIGYDQGAAVRALLKAAGFADVNVNRDLAGHDRVVSAAWPGRTGGVR